MQLTPTLRILTAILGVILVVLGIWYFSKLVFYVLGAAVIAIIGKPLVNLILNIHFKKYKPSRALASTVTLFSLLAIILGTLYITVPVTISKLGSLGSNTDISHSISEPILNLQDRINKTFPSAQISFKEMINERIEPLLNSDLIKDTVGTTITFTTEILIAIFCVSFIAFFFLKDENMFSSWVVALFPSKFENNANRAINNATTLIARYFVGISIESFIKLVVVTLSLYLLGMDLNTAMIVGMITAVLNVIPYVGPLIGGAIGIAIALISNTTAMDTETLIIQVLAVLIVFQLIDNMLLQPYIYASSVKAHPLEIFIIILMAGQIASITGMLLAVPAYTVIRVFAKEFLSNVKLVQKLTENI